MWKGWRRMRCERRTFEWWRVEAVEEVEEVEEV